MIQKLLLGLFCMMLTQVVWADEKVFQGLIEAHEMVNVGVPVSGVLAKVYVERGDLINKGQPLAKLESKVEEAAVALAQGHYEFAQRKASRNEELIQKKLISLHEKDKVETERHIALLELREAKERVRQRAIISPVKGVVVELFYDPSEYVKDYEIMRVAQIDPLNIEVVIPVELFGEIKKGMKAKVIPEILMAKELEATVVIVDRVVDAASGTFGVRLELENHDYKVPAGIKCKVIF